MFEEGSSKARNLKLCSSQLYFKLETFFPVDNSIQCFELNQITFKKVYGVLLNLFDNIFFTFFPFNQGLEAPSFVALPKRIIWK
jgi:hypothetical protein